MIACSLVLERIPSGWLAHRNGGRPFAVSGPSETASTAELREFADRSASKLQCAPKRCALVLDGRRYAPRDGVSTQDPGAPLLLTRTLAVAHLFGDRPERFATVDLDGEPAVARLISRRSHALIEEALVSADPARVGEVLRMLQIGHAVIRSGEGQREAAAHGYARALGSGVHAEILMDDGAHIRGATAALEQRHGAGVRELGPEHLQIAVERTIRYDLYRLRNPVFSVNDTTLADVADGHPVFFVIDRSVESLYGEALRHYSREQLAVAGEFVCNATERDKTVQSVEEICRAAYQAGLRRDGIIVAVGGGVTLDLAGFAASVFRRGVPYVRIPTTLIGLVDVAIGVKQACNAFGAKNLLGSFYPPVAGILDYNFLRTLPTSGLSAGFAEILKMAVLRDEALLADVERYGRRLVDSGFQLPAEAGLRIAARAELLMAEELAPNLLEDDLARRVDFGHTFSPLIETRSEYRITHGEAVALDMLLSTAIAVNRGICASALLSRLLRTTAALKLPCWHPEMPDTAGLNEALTAARRHRGGALNLVVPRHAGAVTFLQEVTMAELATAAADLERAAACQGSGSAEAGLLLHEAPTVKEGNPHAGLGL